MTSPGHTRWAVAACLLLAACPKSGLEVDLGVPEAEQRVDLGGPMDVLTQAANDLDPTPRGRALGLLVQSSDQPAGGEWGPRGLYDPSPWVQRQVVEALATRLPEPESAAALRVVAERSDVDPYVRATAGFRLAAAGDTSAREALSHGWKTEKQSWRRAPLAAAALAAGDTEALQTASGALASGDVALEVDFVLDLGRAGLTELLPALREGGEVVEEELVLPYAAARVALGDASGEGPLRRALSNSDEIHRLEALDYLSRMHEPAATALLRKARSNDSDVVGWYATLALAGRGEQAAERLIAGMGSDDNEVRRLALRFAGELGQGGLGSKKDVRLAREVLATGLAADEPTLREAALRGLLAMGVDGERPNIELNLGNEYLAVRVEAAAVLLLSKS